MTVPELILTNGDVRTQDVRQPAARAVAIGAGRVLAVGADETVRPLAGDGTRTIDLGGRLVLPGMTDAHFHYYEWALNRRNLALAGAATIDDLLDRVATRAGQTAIGDWIVGQGWNEAEWPEPRMPLRGDLDAAAPDHPVVLWRCDMHLAVANSRALAAAGIHAGTPDPPEGVIERDATGRLTGVLRELAINRVREAMPRPSDTDIMAALKEGMPALHRLGLTGIHDVRLMNDADGATALRALQRLDEAGVLDLRCWVTLPGERLDEAAALGLRTGFGNDRLRIGHVKYFADGGMGARTAWLIAPYLDAGCGMPLTPIPELASAIATAEAAGLAVMVHAIGDRANRELIGLFEDMAGKRPVPGSEAARPAVAHRIEHVQMIRPEDISRLAGLHVTACVQPHNMILDINMIDASVGERGRWTYAFRRLLDAGVPVMFSSDSPVCDPSPLVGIHAAVTRQRTDGTPAGGWYPDARVSVADAVRAYTLTPAEAHGVDDQQGSITAGKRADMIVLDQNIFTIDPMDIARVNVDMTFFDGRMVYQRQ